MRACILLSAVVACCIIQVAQGTDSNLPLKDRVRGLVATASSIANNLRSVKDHFSSNLDSKLAEAKEYYIKEGSANIAADIQQIRAAVEAAKAEGKDADHCLKDSKFIYDKFLADVREDIEKYVSTSISMFKPALERLEATIGVAQNDVSKLEAIIPECTSSNQMKERTCLQDNLVWATAHVKNLEITATKVERATKSSSANAIREYHISSSERLDSLYTDCIEQKQKALVCVKNAV